MSETVDSDLLQAVPAIEPLSPTEARILGCLVEKQALTPDVYPLTENAIVTASNQKTSRDPVLQLEPGEVAHALRRMEERGLVRVAPSSQRVRRYEHRFDETYGTTSRQRAVLCLMLLRGPQTLPELLSRSERLFRFPSLEDVRDTLERLMNRAPALVTCLGRAAGQREDRYMHLLSGAVDAEAWQSSAATASAAEPRSGLAERVERLEAELASLREELDTLRTRVEGG